MRKRNRTGLLLILIIAFLLIPLFFAGRKKEKELQIQPKAESSRKAKKASLRISVAGEIVSNTNLGEFIYLLDYISKKLGRPVDVVQRKSHQEVIDLIKNRKVDVAFVCGAVYVKLRQDFETELLAVPLAKGKPVYYSYIIVRKDSDINDFTQLKGESFFFSDPLSNSGKIYPTYLLMTRGTTPQVFFSQYSFTYNHEDSIKAVADGAVSGAAVNSLVFENLSFHNPERVKGLKVIWKSPPLGIPPVIVRTGLDAKLKARVKEIFLNIHKDNQGEKIIKKLMIDKFIEGDDKVYDSIRQMKAALGEK